jgi:UPF0755 protein
MTTARLLVVLFALVITGVAVAVGGLLLGGSSPLLGPMVGNVLNLTSPVAPQDETKEVFTVEPGASAAQIGGELQQRGLIRSALAFRMVADEHGVAGSLAAGDYELSRSMSTEEIVQVLARGQVKRGLVATIPEGWRAEQIADRLEAVGFSSREEFLRAVANPRSVPGTEQLGNPPTLEGYLFPWTYEVRERVSGTRAAELMVRMFASQVGDKLMGGSPDGKLNAHQLLTLASIVEREAQHPGERTTIASVFLNRLEQGMPLQADPTVQYAVANKDEREAAGYGYWKGDLSPMDLQLDSPFNTYTRPGLPPSPICNPGDAAIQAVLQPAKTDYLYFVAKGDGSHVFARTLEEHNTNVSRLSQGEGAGGTGEPVPAR